MMLIVEMVKTLFWVATSWFLFWKAVDFWRKDKDF